MSDTPIRTHILQGRLAAHKGKRDELIAQLLLSAELMKTIDTCRLYIVSTSALDVEAVYVTEMWDSVEDHQASLTRDDVHALVLATRPLINGAPSGARLTPAGGKGVTQP